MLEPPPRQVQPPGPPGATWAQTAFRDSGGARW